MTDAAALHHLASVLATAGEQGERTNQTRLRSTERGRDLVAGLDQVWASPVSEELSEQLRTYYARALTTGPPFSRGFQVFAELAGDARRIATELAEAEQSELSWLQRVEVLGRAVATGVHDVVSEQDLAAHERARDDYRRAMSRHEQARAQADALRRQWRERAESATRAVDLAVGSIEHVDLRVPELVDNRFVSSQLGRSEIRALWSVHVAAHVAGLDPSAQQEVWNTLDAAERAVLIEQLPGWVSQNFRELLSVRELRLLTEALRAPVSTISQSMYGGIGVSVSLFEVFSGSLGARVTLSSETTTMTDGTVEMQFRASELQEAGLGALFVLSASAGLETDGWVVLRFDSVEEHEQFLEALSGAVPNPVAMVQVLNDANSRYVEGFGTSTGLVSRLELDVPTMLNVAAAGGATAFSDEASGEAGVRFNSELSVDAGMVPSGHASVAVAATIFTTPQGRHFVRIEGSGMLLAGVGPRNGPLRAAASSGHRGQASMVVEIRPENQDRVEALVGALVDRDADAVNAAIDDLYDASHITVSQSSVTENQVGVSPPIPVLDLSAGGSSITSETDFHLEKRPFDQPHVHRF